MKLKPSVHPPRPPEKVDLVAPPTTGERAAVPSEHAVGVELPRDPIDAFSMTAELAARGLIDRNTDGVIEAHEIAPSAFGGVGQQAAFLRLKEAAGDDGVLQMGEVVALDAPKATRTQRARATAVVERVVDGLDELIGAWPPADNDAATSCLAGIDALVRELGSASPTQLGLAPTVALRLLRDRLQDVAEVWAQGYAPPANLRMNERRGLDALSVAAASMSAVSTALGGVEVSGPTMTSRSIPDAVIKAARAKHAEGDLVGAWSALGDAGDTYASEAARIVDQGDAPTGLFPQIVRSHWDRIAGPEKTAELFEPVAQHHLDNYLLVLEHTGGAMPDTESIESSYRDAVEVHGLPPELAIDSVLSKMDLMLNESPAAQQMGLSEFSWGSLLGLEADRVVLDSRAFADVDMKPVSEFLATTRHTLGKFGMSLDVGDALRLLGNAGRAIWAEQPPKPAERTGPPTPQLLRVDDATIASARAGLDRGDAAAGFAALHDGGDGYAHYPHLALAEIGQPKSLLGQVVDAHWDRLVGRDVLEAELPAVGLDVLSRYLGIIEGDGGRLPTSKEIEECWRGALEDRGLSPALAPDAVMSRLSDGAETKDVSWAGMVGLAEERVVYRTGVFSDLDMAPMKELFADNIHWIVQRNVQMPFAQMAKMTFERVRDLFS